MVSASPFILVLLAQVASILVYFKGFLSISSQFQTFDVPIRTSRLEQSD